MRALRLFAAVAVPTVLAGCASAEAGAPTAPAPSPPSSTSAPATGAATPATGAATPGSSTAGPSESATMVCGPEIAKDVATVLAAASPPTTTSTWSDHLYTCTYHLPDGTLVLSVKESADVPSATAYFTGLRQHLGTTTALTGAQGLGNPGYESPSGSVVILKDDKTLQVDATGLPARSGPSRLSRADVAYEIATDVIGCWNGD